MNPRKEKAQNRISYLVYHNPEGVRNLIAEYGYDAPTDEHELVKATKKLVREKGIDFTTALLKHHPERSAILGTCACKSEEQAEQSNFCGACGTSNYDGLQPQVTLDTMTVDQLELYYHELVAESREFPKDSSLARQIETVRSMLNAINAAQAKGSAQEKKSADSAGTAPFEFVNRSQLLGIGVAFFIGLIVAKSIS
jgi:hypothetical protein